ncbi:MAG: multiheme c-type cytochrome [Myxococcales bacterium]|nr:multiheme c-type cytochrome [Myxococcales bacterium]MDD9969792.1 multiheme c-type cytochrome [Myxococcales bacterium]
MSAFRISLTVLLFLGACKDRESVDLGALTDPVSCAGCHPKHYEQWSGSMHAYASNDPMFVELNRLAQEQTDGAVGGFCVGCHAPVALRLGETEDGLNIEEVPQRHRGITCYFCHQIDAIEGEHNAAVGLAHDNVFRAGHRDPLATPAHRSSYSELHDGSRTESSDLCGVCHDVVTPAGVELENTYKEWQASIFGDPEGAPVTCSGCHMPGENDRAAEVDGAPMRRIHDHRMPGVDVALQDDWPDQEAQRAAIQRDLDPSITAQLCVTPDFQISITVENLIVGHAWPSGVTHARRAWVEVVAYDGDEQVFASGQVSEKEAVFEFGGPDLWSFGTEIFDDAGDPVHFSWQATDITSNLLPPTMVDPDGPSPIHTRTRIYRTGVPFDHVAIAVKIRPVGLDVVDAIIHEGGKLPDDLRERIPTFTLASTELNWRKEEDGWDCVGN